ncbi:MAG: sensor histidine kinase [Candidatus Kapaibacteriota bacterium]
MEKKNHLSNDILPRYTQYGTLYKVYVSIIIIVSVTPLIILTALNYFQFRKTYEIDVISPLVKQTANIKNNLESFLEERISILKYISEFYSISSLKDKNTLGNIFQSLRNSFEGFVDIGVLDSNGLQFNYIGMYNLLGKNYKSQDWFLRTLFTGINISDVYEGYRGVPHFSISVLKNVKPNEFYIIRASINSQLLNNKIYQGNLNPETDIFIINYRGILQTNSKYFGMALEKYPLPVPEYTANSENVKTIVYQGRELYQISFYIKNSPFILIETTSFQSLWGNWVRNRNQLLIITILSIGLIVIVSLWGGNKFINLLKEKDLQAAKIFHEIEYTNKMASIGRLAAGIAHEINNPLAIINESAGMINDILKNVKEFPEKEKIQKYLNTIFKNIERSSKITHQLLGFAKRMEPNITLINLAEFIAEVVEFVGKQAILKNATISIVGNNDEPITISTDKGLLQQVFVNILNNSFEAISDGGKIEISYKKIDDKKIEIKISDNGIGISEKDLPHIFEPFYTTKKEYGTGLGLSITYGIVKKLGGDIFVESKPNVGTTFILIFPIT